MQVAEAKRSTPAKSQIQAKRHPFFSKEGQGSFFSKSAENSSSFFSPSMVQPKLTIGQPNDKYEVEADAMADKVVQRFGSSESDTIGNSQFGNRALGIQSKCMGCKEDEKLQKKEDEKIENDLDLQTKSTVISNPDPPKDEEHIQTKSEGSSNHTLGLENKLSTTKGGGRALDPEMQNSMGSAFGADFSAVRVHTDSNAVQMNKGLNAQAFTHGKDVYFNEGKYRPETESGKHLLAHELTHTVQQGAALHLKSLAFSSAPQMVQGFGIVDLLPDSVKDVARNVPGYSFATLAIGYDPIMGQDVERTPVNLIGGLMGLAGPFGNAVFDKLQELDILQKVFDWTALELERLGLTKDGLLRLIEEAWGEITFPYLNAQDVITTKLLTFLNKIKIFALAIVDQVMPWIKESLIAVAEPILEENKAWSLIKKVIAYDPLRDQEVKASTVEILEDFLLLIDRETELAQMKERGTLQETADWLDTQIGTFRYLIAELRSLITGIWDAIQPENLTNIVENFGILKIRVSSFLDSVWNFAITVATEVLGFIKTSLLNWLNSFASDIPGFTLLTVILEKNPLTDEAVPRSVENVIRGFMGLIPGGEEKFQELKESGVIPSAAGQIEVLIAQLGFTWERVKLLFTEIWGSISIEDLIDPLAAFERIGGQFGVPITELFNFVVKVVMVLINLILEVMGIPPDMIANIVANAMQAFEDIKKDPIGFLMSLMSAIKEGFIGFLNNIGTHLLSGFQNWLFGTLADAGIQMPSDLTIRSILGLSMDVLGITVDNILERLALKIGEEKMAKIRSVLDKLDGIWAFVRDVIERGPIAIWEYVQSQISNLWQIVKDGIMGFIQEKVIQQAIGWLLSFLDVTGIMPIIRGVQTVFNAIMSFVEKLKEILGIVNSFVAGVVDIAKGSVQSAASFLETALADGIPIAISFLARQLGLGNISDKIQQMIEDARALINEAIDWLIDQAMAAGTAFLRVLGLGNVDQEGTRYNSNLTVGDNEDVRELAINELRRRIRTENLRSISEINSERTQVFNHYSMMGLSKLNLSISNENTLDIQISAAASPDMKVTIAFEEAFKGLNDKNHSDLTAGFSKQGMGTYAAISVNGLMIGTKRSSDNGHAEEELLSSGIWDNTLDKVEELLSQNKIEISVVLAINRTPCHSRCSVKLTEVLRNDRCRRFISSGVRFILAPTGTYLPTKPLSEGESNEKTKITERINNLLTADSQIGGEERATLRKNKNTPRVAYRKGDFTTSKDLKKLISVGWDLRQLYLKEEDVGKSENRRDLNQFLSTLNEEFAIHFERTLSAPLDNGK